MIIASRIVTLGLVGSFVVACRGSSADTSTPPPAHHEGAPGKMMDSRTPVPLTAMMATHQKQEMRDHLRVIQEITTALATDDFDAITKSASRIGWSEQQAAMCKHMGAGAPGFAAVGENFHHSADGIIAAARKRDHAAVTSAVGATLATCVGCHESYRQDIVDDAAFAKLAGSADVSCPMMNGK
jgi:cytochrome c556